MYICIVRELDCVNHKGLNFKRVRLTLEINTEYNTQKKTYLFWQEPSLIYSELIYELLKGGIDFSHTNRQK